TLAPLALVLLASCASGTHHGPLLADSSVHSRSPSPATSSPPARTRPDPLGPIRASHVDDVRLLEGALRAVGFQVGPFYLPRGKFLYPVDDSLEIHPDAVLA